MATLTKRGNSWVLNWTDAFGLRHKKSLGACSEGMARETLTKVRDDLPALRIRQLKRTPGAALYQPAGPMRLGWLYRQTQKNAVRRGIAFHLTRDDLEKLWQESGGRCSISGVQFNRTLKRGRCRPYAPSIDRMDSSGPYTFRNCRLVCVFVNLAIGSFGLDVLEEVALGMRQHSKFCPRVWR